jgi:2-phosphoglycerate kinase
MAVYLIGGPPKCGKTTLAKTMSKKLGIPWISSDTLENIVSAYTPKKERPVSFPHAYLRGDTNDELYAAHSAEEIVQGYVQQGKATYDAIEMMAETYITDEDDFIVEGYQVDPEIVHRIFKKFGHEHIKTVFLIKKDELKLVKDFHKSTTPNDWILRKTKQENTFGKIARMIAVYSDYIQEGSKKYDLPVFEMDSNFTDSIEKAMKHLTAQ